MSSSSSYAEAIRRIYIEAGLEGNAEVERALIRLPGIPWAVVAGRAQIPPEDLNRTTLFVSRTRGRRVARCPGSPGQVCCAYLTLDLYQGCPLGCRYCIMESYLNFSPLTVYVDVKSALEPLLILARSRPGRMLRVGSGETGDSLFLDPLFELSSSFIRALAPFPHAFFEMKTKTDLVDHLAEIEPKGNAVIGFSLNPQGLIEAYEAGTTSLEERLQAAERAAACGFLLSFHFDPLILHPGWEEHYQEVVASLARFNPKRIAWVSLGTFRYPPELKQELPDLDLFLEEFVPGRDGKFRYPQTVRAAMYRRLRLSLERLGIEGVYLCMESPAVWKNVCGGLPRQKPALRDIFVHADPVRGILPRRRESMR